MVVTLCRGVLLITVGVADGGLFPGGGTLI